MYAGFKRQAPPTYEYVNTKELTGETISFGLNSERQNQKLLFLLWDNWGPINDLGLITGKVPYTDFVKLEQKVDSGQQGIGGGPFTWLAGRFIRAADSKIELAFVGAYRSPVEDKAVVVIGRSFSDEQPLDYNLTISVVDSMAADYSKRAIKDGAVKPGAQKPEQPVATSEEVSAYTTKVQSLVQGKFSFPEIDEESEEELRTKVMFRLDENGKLVKIELVNGSGEERYDQAVLRAINANVPYPKPPYTGKETFTVYVTASDGQIAAKAG